MIRIQAGRLKRKYYENNINSMDLSLIFIVNWKMIIKAGITKKNIECQEKRRRSKVGSNKFMNIIYLETLDF